MTTRYIETPRLILRDWQDSDLLPFTEMNADPKVMEYFVKPLTAEESSAFFLRIRNELADFGYGAYAVERKTDGKFLGFTGLHRIPFEADFTPGIEIAWRLSREAWGNGYATEAAAACLEYADKRLGLREIYAFTTLQNRRSERVMQKTGMQRIGIFDHPLLDTRHPLRKHVLYKINFQSLQK